MDLWMHDLRDNPNAQLTEERGAVSGPAWSPDGNHIAYRARSSALARARSARGDSHRLRVRRRHARGEIGRPTWSPTVSRSRSAPVPVFEPLSRRAQPDPALLVEHGRRVLVAAVPGAFRGQSSGHRSGLVARRLPHGVCQRRRAVDRARGRARRRHRARRNHRRPINRSRRAGKATRSTSSTRRRRGLRRVIADGSIPERIPLDLTWRNGSTAGAHRGARRPRRRRRVRSGARAGRHRHRVAASSAASRMHRDELHTGAVVDASNEYVMPGLIEMHAHLDDGYGENFGRVWLAYGITSLRIPSVNPYAGLEQREVVRRRAAAGAAPVSRRRSVRRRARLLSGRRRRSRRTTSSNASSIARRRSASISSRPTCGCPIGCRSASSTSRTRRASR